ncbi:MAG: uracil-DNA glycosylase [Desulforhopalus sp.]
MMGVVSPNCLKCRHYFITHDPCCPYGCRAMAFKSRINPARMVYESSGIVCQLFAQKKQGRSDPDSKRVA